MDDHEVGSSPEQQLDEELARELRRLEPLLQRQFRAAAVRPDPSFKAALRAQLTSAPRAAPAKGAIATWRTLIAMLVPTAPQLSLRGDGPQVMTYAAGEVTISLTARPADDPDGRLISLYGEADYPDASTSAESVTVDLLRGDAILATAVLDELGNFVLQNLLPGVYALRLRFPDRQEVVIPPTRYSAEREIDKMDLT
jgi:hypothetical protein